MRILIVEDEKKLSDILQRSLKSEGYMVDGVHTAADGLEYAKSYHYDLLIIDLQLPDGTGTMLLKQLRELGHTMPALILTARSDLDSKVENFQAGAAAPEESTQDRAAGDQPPDPPGQARRQAYRAQPQGIFPAGISFPASRAHPVAQHDRGKNLGPVLRGPDQYR